MDYHLISRIAFWLIFWPALALILKYVYTAKRDAGIRLLLVVESTLVFLSFIPLLLINSTRLSILNLVFAGATWFGIMMVSYTFGLVVLFFHKRVLEYLSAFFLALGAVAVWIGAPKYVPDSLLNYVIKNDAVIAVLWMFVFFILPGATFLLYLVMALLRYEKERPRENLILEPKIETKTRSRKSIFKMHMSYFFYFFFGAIIIFMLSVLIYNASSITESPSFISVIFVILLLGAIIFFGSLLYGSTIILTEDTLVIPSKKFKNILSVSREQIRLQEIGNAILATGSYFFDLSNSTKNLNLKKEIDKYNSPYVPASQMQFLYIVKNDGLEKVFSVSAYANKKLLAFAQELYEKGVRTEVHL